MKQVGPVSRAGSVCRDLGTSFKRAKNQVRDCMENFSPASWDPNIAMPGSRQDGLKINHVIVIVGPTLFRH